MEALLLLAAAFCNLFLFGRYMNCFVAWFFPLFVEKYFSGAGRAVWKRWIMCSLAIIPSRAIALHRVFFFDKALLYSLIVSLALLHDIAPYAFSRWVRNKRYNSTKSNAIPFQSTLVLPVAVVTWEFLICSLTDGGSWHSIAYTQFENKPLLQLASVTGYVGISFVMTWTASMVVWYWNIMEMRGESNDVGTEKAKSSAGKRLLAGLLVVVAIFMLGSLRMIIQAPDSPRIRTAAVSVHDSFDMLLSLRPDAAPKQEWEQYKSRFEAVNRELLRLTENEARAGSKLITWSELGSVVLSDGSVASSGDEAITEKALIAATAQVAKRHKVYIGMGLSVYHLNPNEPSSEFISWVLDNKYTMINPDGEVEYEYYKNRPVPYGEKEKMRFPSPVQGLKIANAKISESLQFTMSSAICFDLDFPDLFLNSFSNKSGYPANNIPGKQHKGVDIVTGPASDYDMGLNPMHSIMAAYRAVEQGFNLIRNPGQAYGTALAVDYLGNVLASVDFTKVDPLVMVAHLPTRGVTSAYSIIGSSFAFICIGLLFAWSF